MDHDQSSISDIPHVTTSTTPDLEHHHGGLRPVAGVHSYQVFRADRRGTGVARWTYNHAPMLAYRNGTFYLQYLSNPVSEHVPPGRTLLTTSPDGRRWAEPLVLFDVYTVAGGTYPGVDPELTRTDTHAVMHQRMGFYVAPNGRFLTLGFYGFSPSPKLPPFDRLGLGRVVREIYEDDTWGPTYFIHLNGHAGWTTANTTYPWFESSADSGFVEACHALLGDTLVIQQWLEEHGPADPRIPLQGLFKALSYYTLPDGRVAAVWKWSKAGVTGDRGRTWQAVGDSPSIETAGGKVWGQRTSDGRYALVYNPTLNNRHRWPLGLTVSQDGLRFGELYCACGDVSPRRYAGGHKDYGLNYVRGIAEGNGTSPDGAAWFAYSMNKEDIWITRVEVPIRTDVTDHVDDDFGRVDQPSGVTAGHDGAGARSRGTLANWSIFSPRLAPVAVGPAAGINGRCLLLQDGDPYDYAAAARPFPERAAVKVHMEVSAGQSSGGRLFVELHDPTGRIPVRLVLDKDGAFQLHHSRGVTCLGEYRANRCYGITFMIDAARNRYALLIDGERTGFGQVYNGEDWSEPYWYFAASVRTVSRLVFRTKPVNREPNVDTPIDLATDLPQLDPPSVAVEFRVHRVRTDDLPDMEER